MPQMQAHYDVFEIIFQDNLKDLFLHFKQNGVLCDFYLREWFTFVFQFKFKD